MIQRCSGRIFYAETSSGSLRKRKISHLDSSPSRNSKTSKGVPISKDDYLLGRFGGVPVIRDFSWLRNPDG